MARHFTIASAIDKNKIDSINAWLVLVDIDVKDAGGTHVEYVRLVQNNENITYKGNLYTAAEFDIGVNQAMDEEPTMKFTAFDPTGVVRQKMEEYAGGVGFAVTVAIINTANMLADPEIEEVFQVVDASAPGFNVSWTLGVENPLKHTFPPRKQFRDRCMFKYKGLRCKYAGPLPSCDFSKDGANGCRVHNNIPNIGSFGGLKS